MKGNPPLSKQAMAEEQAGRRHFLHLMAFCISAFTLGFFTFWFITKTGANDFMRNPQLIKGINEQVMPILEWGAIVGGAICASIIMTKTAWAFYGLGGMDPILGMELRFRRAKGKGVEINEGSGAAASTPSETKEPPSQ